MATITGMTLHTWARRHADSVTKWVATTVAERAAGAAIVHGGCRVAQHLGMCFEMGDTLLPGPALRRRSTMGIECGAPGRNAFRGSNDGAGRFRRLDEGHPLREHAGRARPRFRHALIGSALTNCRLTKRLDRYSKETERAVHSGIVRHPRKPAPGAGYVSRFSLLFRQKLGVNPSSE